MELWAGLAAGPLRQTDVVSSSRQWMTQKFTGDEAKHPDGHQLKSAGIFGLEFRIFHVMVVNSIITVSMDMGTGQQQKETKQNEVPNN